jgi:hypothetical protein
LTGFIFRILLIAQYVNKFSRLPYKAHDNIKPKIAMINPICRNRLVVARKLPGKINWISKFTRIRTNPIIGSSPFLWARYSDM